MAAGLTGGLHAGKQRPAAPYQSPDDTDDCGL